MLVGSGVARERVWGQSYGGEVIANEGVLRVPLKHPRKLNR